MVPPELSDKGAFNAEHVNESVRHTYFMRLDELHVLGGVEGKGGGQGSGAYICAPGAERALCPETSRHFIPKSNNPILLRIINSC